MSRSENRFAGLDVLRGVAVLLVFVRHVPIYPRLHLGLSEHILELFVQVGWMGVDLFFVLSGFLIAGLLFADARRHGTVRLRRFWIRRGLKIWPCYFLVYGVWLTAHLCDGTDPIRYTETVLVNCLFIQNYFDPLPWPASWSLAVEEHFYLILPLVVVAGVAVAGGWTRRQTGWAVAITGAVGMVVPLVVRVCAARPGGDFLDIYLPTHCRFDCLLVGVLLRYVHDYAPAAFALLARRATVLTPLLLATVAAIAIRFPFVKHPDVHAWTFTLNAVAFACWIAAVVAAPAARGGVVAALGWVGRYSYTMYLVHAVIFQMPWMSAVMTWAMAAGGGQDSPLFLWGYRLSYWVISLGGGYVLAKVVEQPVIRWRDRVWPSASGSPAAAASAAPTSPAAVSSYWRPASRRSCGRCRTTPASTPATAPSPPSAWRN